MHGVSSTVVGLRPEGHETWSYPEEAYGLGRALNTQHPTTDGFNAKMPSTGRTWLQNRPVLAPLSSMALANLLTSLDLSFLIRNVGTTVPTALVRVRWHIRLRA